MALVDEYKAQVEEFARACLDPYVAAIADPNWRCPSAKELNDCVWQTVVLRPFEVIFLDSPLLQRLRYVRLEVVNLGAPLARPMGRGQESLAQN